MFVRSFVKNVDISVCEINLANSDGTRVLGIQHVLVKTVNV